MVRGSASTVRPSSVEQHCLPRAENGVPVRRSTLPRDRPDDAPMTGRTRPVPVGAGVVVVFVPGLGLDARAWRTVRSGLDDESVVVLLPSLGEPAPRGTALGVEHQAQRLLRDLPSGRELVLVGHSASCPVVVEAAARSADVIGLVLVGPVTDPQARTWPSILRQWVRTALHERLWELPILAPQYRRTGVLTMLRGIDAIRHFPTHVALGPLPIPVEVLRGQFDRIAPSPWCRQLVDLADGDLTSVEGAAHMLPLTHPQAIVSAIGRVVTTARGITTGP
jgi:pimeloyl-ACP methyl ester carboxylesterase